jgi:hypothetical protein
VPTSPADVAGGEPVEESVSYERDFAPLAQRYFQMTFGKGMKPNAAYAAFAPADAMLKSAYAEKSQMRALDEQSRNRRIQYETSVFALESARNKAREERDMMDGLGPIQRRRALGAFGVKNAAVLGTNKLADGMYRSALNSAVDEKEDQSKYTVKDWYVASRGMGDGYLKEVETRLGRPLEMDDELPLGEVMPRLSALNKKLAEDKDKADRDEKSTAFRDKQREETFSRVNRIELVPGESIADEKTGKLVKAPSTLKDSSDDIVIDSIVTFAGTPEERTAYGSMTLDDKLRLAKKIQIEIGLGKRNATGTSAGSSKASTISGLAPPPKE